MAWVKPPNQPTVVKTKEQLFTSIHELAKKQTLKIGARGIADSGKTHLCCSASEFDENCPTFTKEDIPASPVYILETEGGAAQLAQNFPGRDIKVLNCYVSTGDPQMDCKASLDLMKEAINSLRDLERGTICIDTGTDLWEWIGGVLRLEILKVDLAARVAPSDYKWANAEYRSIMERCRAINAHFIITAVDSEVFRDAKLTPTGVYKADWQKWTPRYVDCVIRLMKEETKAGYTYRSFIEKFRHHRLEQRDFLAMDFITLYNIVKPYLRSVKV